MGKVLVVSDSHGNCRALEAIIDAEPDFEVLVYCGDGIKDIAFLPLRESVTVVAVPGNIDRFSPMYNEELVITNIFGVMTAVTHGHLYGVKHTMGQLILMARQLDASLVLFGHTHEPVVIEHENRMFVNPGVSGAGQYAVLEITNKVASTKLKKVGL
ncbi:MAG TPA: YfcE family phosphodiesterase [Spirochaetota bacterium]|nr:YfcE family phosphodiesterase [Spirochaetota bacterium]